MSNKPPYDPYILFKNPLYSYLYKRSSEIVRKSPSAQRVMSDNELRNLKSFLRQSDIKSVLEHNNEYNTLLSSYAGFLSRTLKSKRIMKNIFFVISILLILLVTLIMFFGLYCFFCDIKNNSSDDYKKYILEIISSMTPFVSTLMVIPKIIAKYLFNSNEEATANKIVKNIQNYDNGIREREEKREKSQEQKQELEE